MHFGNLALTWQSAYAAVHDRVTNGSKMLQTQQYSLVYNTKFDDKWALIHTFWGHRKKRRQKREQREEEEGKKETKAAAKLSFFKSVATARYLANHCIR